MGERDESEVVVAIEGDGEMWCLSCAKQRYGETCVEALVGLMPGCEQSIDQWEISCMECCVGVSFCMEWIVAHVRYTCVMRIAPVILSRLMGIGMRA